jgi:heptosyltransferase-1
MVAEMEHGKILVLRLSAVGDVIRTLPAVKALKKRLPSSRIAWVVEEPSKTFLESQPDVDQVILFPRRTWAEGRKSLKGLLGAMSEMGRFVKNLRKERFDVVLDFHGILKSGVISFLSGSPTRVGFDRKASKEANFLFSNVKVKLPEQKLSRYRRNFALLKGVGLEENSFEAGLSIPAKDRLYVDSFLERLGMPLKRSLIAIHAGTSLKTSYKRWMPERYSQLADRLIRELKATVLFTWGPEELDWIENIRRQMAEPSILGPRTESLTQLGEVYRRCDLYIGGDTGPMHIASMVGIPVVAIYGPTDPVVNEPFGKHRKVRSAVGCSPCRNRSCKKLICLETVKVDDVFNAAKEVLS